MTPERRAEIERIANQFLGFGWTFRAAAIRDCLAEIDRLKSKLRTASNNPVTRGSDGEIVMHIMNEQNGGKVQSADDGVNPTAAVIAAQEQSE